MSFFYSGQNSGRKTVLGYDNRQKDRKDMQQPRYDTKWLIFIASLIILIVIIASIRQFLPISPLRFAPISEIIILDPVLRVLCHSLESTLSPFCNISFPAVVFFSLLAVLLSTFVLIFVYIRRILIQFRCMSVYHKYLLTFFFLFWQNSLIILPIL